LEGPWTTQPPPLNDAPGRAPGKRICSDLASFRRDSSLSLTLDLNDTIILKPAHRRVADQGILRSGPPPEFRKTTPVNHASFAFFPLQHILLPYVDYIVLLHPWRSQFLLPKVHQNFKVFRSYKG